jgi:hypothetical protein
VTALALAALAAPAAAHHSGAMFDRSKKVTVSGVITEFLYANPHSWIDLNVTGADGKVVEWAFEGGAPSQMKSVGLTPSVLKTGDKVTVTGYPLRDGRPAGAFLEIVMPDGKLITTSTRVQPQTPPAAPTPAK